MQPPQAQRVHEELGLCGNPERIVAVALVWIGLALAGDALGAASLDGAGDQAATPTEMETGERDESAEAKESLASRVTIHGFLSQAFAKSDGNQIAGIPKDGTADYRTAALQIRADLTDSDVFAVQLSHERIGASPQQSVRPDVDLDWIFYQRQFGSNSSIKVGRMPLPLGIYSEVRDVGPALPFYRPPRGFYGEGAFTTETVDGVILTHRFKLHGDWRLAGDVYYGSWSGFDDFQNPLSISDAVGFQLYLDTPVKGLRLGAGGIQFESDANAAFPRLDWRGFHGSIQAAFGRFEGELEYRDGYARVPGGPTLFDVKIGHVRVGVALTERLKLQSQLELLKIKLFPLPEEFDYDEDRVLGLAFRFRPDLVLKAEHHWNEGYFLDPQLNPFGPAGKTRYGILSLAVSF